MMKKEVYQLAARGISAPSPGIPLNAQQVAIHHLYKPAFKSQPMDNFSINPPTEAISDINAFGYLIKGEAETWAMTFVGARVLFGDQPSQEDRLEINFLDIPRWYNLGAHAKQAVLKNTIMILGNELLELDTEGTCIADTSGSTLAVTVADSEGITWGSVGDSYIMTCLVKEDGRVFLSLANKTHTVNSAEVLKIKKTNPEILKTMMANNVPNSTAWPRICGLEMSRVMGNEMVNENGGIVCSPDVNTIFYDDIKEYDAECDRLFVLNASDGLFNSKLLKQEEVLKITNERLPTWKAPPLWDESNLTDEQKAFCQKLDNFDARDQLRQEFFLQIYKNCIENKLKSVSGDIKANILNAISGEIASRCHDNLSNAPDNISCTQVPAGPMMSKPILALVADGHCGAESASYIQANLPKKLKSILNENQLSAGILPFSEGGTTSESASPISNYK